MNLKTIAIAATLIVGISSFFMSILLSIGLAHRQPAEVVIDHAICHHLAPNTSIIQGEQCKLQVDDYKKNGGLIELRWMDKDKPLSDGKAISVPSNSIQVVIELPKQPLPIWLYLVFAISMLMTLLPLRHLAFMRNDGEKRWE